MPIVVALIALVALIYGAARTFDAIQAAFGLTAALGAAVLAALLLFAAVAYWLRRRRQVAANVHGDGDWTHELKGAWGCVRAHGDRAVAHIAVCVESNRPGQPVRSS